MEAAWVGVDLDELRLLPVDPHVYNGRCTIRCVLHLSQLYSVRVPVPCYSMDSLLPKKFDRSPALVFYPRLPFDSLYHKN